MGSLSLFEEVGGVDSSLSHIIEEGFHSILPHLLDHFFVQSVRMIVELYEGFLQDVHEPFVLTFPKPLQWSFSFPLKS